jgi:hypothetical protein
MSKKNTKTDNANRRQFLSIGSAAAATLALGAVTNNQAQTSDSGGQGCATALSNLAAQGRHVRVLGKVSDGKVIFDQASLDEFAATYPDAEMAFVAVNAPFDPVKQISL